ncbi:MAG: hypothetical protein KF802_04305 [Bdellovibrionaceae bacterium]|nr:hypothetical protein [Pseudobdellovibrionaceae bacterium]MBX3034228.1 hypothetical protein [Pseudobdellovibrionaceae bacterium]
MAGEKIPRWLKSFLFEADLAHIEAAVREFESRVSAEIVPMIVRRSSVIGHLPLTITLILSLTLLIVLWPFHDWVSAHDGALYVPLAMLFFALISFPLSRSHRLQRLLIPDMDEELQVRRRAWSEFMALKMTRTEERRGLLLFVSLMERKVVLLHDEGLAGIVQPADVDAWVSDLARRLKNESWGVALTQGIRQIGESLQKPLPRQAGLTDELGNHLQIKE